MQEYLRQTSVQTGAYIPNKRIARNVNVTISFLS